MGLLESAALPVSVVIATYNRGDVLLRTIEMALACTYPAFEVVVVDQTPEPTPSYLERVAAFEQDDRFRYVRVPFPSLTFARNVGTEMARGEVIVFIDDDVEFAPDFIGHHAASYADPSVGAVAGRVYEANYAGARPGEVEEVEEPIGHVNADGSEVGNFHLGRRQEVDFGKGCNMSFRRALLDAVGGCDERYRGGFYREDGDLFARVKRLGVRVVFEPDAALVHLETGGGSRTRGGHLSVYRQWSVFHNETLYYLNCMRPRHVGRHALRMARWAVALKHTRGYTWPETARFAGGVVTAGWAYLFADRRALSARYTRVREGAIPSHGLPPPPAVALPVGEEARQAELWTS